MSSTIRNGISPIPFVYLTDDPEDLLQTSDWQISRFYSIFHLFMLGPTFAPSFRGALQQCYIGSPLLVRDIYMALFDAIVLYTYTSSRDDPATFTRGANSVQKLRTARILGLHDALSIVSLGQALAAFDIMTTSVSSSMILRFSLSMIQPWYAELSENATFDPVTITSLFWDTASCLIRREYPVIKYLPKHTAIVDRLAGICTSLLPLLYDLCVTSYELKHKNDVGRTTQIASIRLIQRRIRLWVPEEPHDLNETFSRQEVLGMRAQALTYQRAGLLIAHRLLNPVGTNDIEAQVYARSIAIEVLKYPSINDPGAQLQHIAMPLLLAAMELPDFSSDSWDKLTLLSMAPKCVENLRAFVNYVWSERQAGFEGCLFDLVDSGPSFAVLP